MTAKQIEDQPAIQPVCLKLHRVMKVWHRYKQVDRLRELGVDAKVKFLKQVYESRRSSLDQVKADRNEGGSGCFSLASSSTPLDDADDAG